MASKRKSDEILSWFEWQFVYSMPYKFRRLNSWSPMANDGVLLANPALAQPILPNELPQDVANQAVEEENQNAMED